MTDYKKIKEMINDADAIIIGAGSGLSTAAGINYSGEDFKKVFKEFIKKYKFTDLYTSSFYPFKTEEEKWAYWSMHINYSYYENKELALYKKIYELVKDKNYFVITTNVDGKFISNKFDKNKVFEVQGSYSKLQCSIPCHNKLYDNEKTIKEMIKNINEKLEIPLSLVPKCPVCHENMSVNLRCDNTFVEDEQWHKMNKKFHDFINKNYNKNYNKKVLLLELGVGFNTPGIIRFPFEEMTYNYDNFNLIRFNDKYFTVPTEIENKSVEISEDINKVINKISKLE